MIGCLVQLSAQNEHKPEIQYWAFMVRNTARLQEIAYRFQVTEADIRKNSDVKGKTVYPGKVITIPVKVRPATWDPTKFNPNKPFLSNEDARPQLDYEWNNEALDPLLKDDYILISEIQGDSVQTQKMNKHIGKIDKRVALLTHQIDSIKNTEFAFQYDEKDMNAVLKRMEKARLRYYAQSPLGKEVDSLNDVKTKLNEEINRLRNKLSEYDYLNENAYYFEKNREGEADMLERVNNRPGEQLIAESNYAKKEDNDLKKQKKKNRFKRKKKKNTEQTPVETVQLFTRDVTQKDSVRASIPKSPLAKESTPNDNKSNSTANGKRIEDERTSNPIVPKQEPQNSALKEGTIEPIGQSKLAEEKTTNTSKEGKLLTTTLSINSSNTLAKNPTTQTTAQQPTSPTLSEKKEVPTSNPTEPVIESFNTRATKQPESLPVNEDLSNAILLPQEKTSERNTASPLQIPQEYTIKPLSERDLSMKEEIKKAIANKVVAKEIDPLDEYSDSPDFAFKGLNFQSIPISKGKNGPKYLTPVDPITALKAKIWIEKFKEEMKIKDFKKAESYLKKAIETNPNSAEMWTFHAEMLSAAGDAQEAQKEYLIATSIDAAFARPYYKMALLYENANNVDKAYEYYAFAIEADSSFYKAYLNRANLSLRQGDLKAAIEDYSTLLDINKNFSLAYKERGTLRMMDRDYSGAVDDFSAYLDIEDPSGEVLYRRGIAKVYTGKIIEGCNDFSLSIQLNYTDAAKAIKKYCE